MFLKILKIIDNKNNEEIRSVKFKLGANFIVDKTNSKQHNKVGKTTFLRLIDVALGAKDRKYIYTDSETGNVQLKLKKLIEDNNISIKLIISENLNNDYNNNDYELEVYLKERGARKINGEKLSYDNFKSFLNNIIFNNDNGYPTFRELINSFIRISMKGDDDHFLRNLSQGTSNDEYRSVYNYLFDLSDSNIDKKHTELSKEISSLSKSLKKYKEFQNVDDIDSINQIISTITNQKEKLKNKLNDIVSYKDFKYNREKINNVREEYTKLSNEIDEIQYRYEISISQINQINENQKFNADENLTKDFFDEIKDSIPNIHKTFQDLIEFNNQLSKNKINYINSIKEKLSAKKKELEVKREKLLGDNKTLISLVENNKIDEYNDLLSDISKRDQEISSYETKQKTILKYQSELDDKKNQINDLNDKRIDNQHINNLHIFNEYFRKYANEINQESPILIYHQVDKHQHTFPLSITDLDGTSTGTRKSLIAAYDFSYQKFASEINKKVPKFIIHDVMENVESEKMKKIISIVNNIKSQYIVGILEENLSLSTKKSYDDVRILELSDNDKLFKI